MPTEVQLAYIAGLIDGEGSIQLSRHTQGQMQPQVRLFNTDLNMINFVNEVIGGNIQVHSDTRPEHKKPVYRLCWSRRSKIVEILRALEPYMITKKAQAQMLLAWCEARGTSFSVDDELAITTIKNLNGGDKGAVGSR